MNTSGIANPSNIQVTVFDQIQNSTYPTLPNTHPTKSKTVSKAQQRSRNEPKHPAPMPTATAGIYEYTVWSRMNVVLGALVLGIFSVILSLLTRKYKRKGDVKISKILSTMTLAWNIFVNVVGLIGGIFLITYYNDPI